MKNYYKVISWQQISYQHCTLSNSIWPSQTNKNQSKLYRKLENGLISILYVQAHMQLVDILTKRASSSTFQNITSKLGMKYIYFIVGGVLK